MEGCVFCKAKDTAQYENGEPVCLMCANARGNSNHAATDQQIRSRLLQDILQLTARIDEASAEFDEVMHHIPSDLPSPDGVLRIKNVSTKLSTARQELMQAHRRLDEYLDRGIGPEDPKRRG